MKNLFRINILTLIMWLLLILSGYLNYLLIFLFIMLFHELGHIFVIKILKYKIEKIIILPCGGIISTNINLNINSNKMFLISISGVLAQLLLFIIVPESSNYNYLIFQQLNTYLIIFNLIPIYPSDGYKIVLSIIERFLSYKYSIIMTYIISYASLFMFFLLTKNIYIFLFLYFYNMNYLVSYKYIYNKFLLERHLNGFKYKKDKIITNIHNIQKNKNNYIIKDKCIYHEKDILARYFS